MVIIIPYGTGRGGFTRIITDRNTFVWNIRIMFPVDRRFWISIPNKLILKINVIIGNFYFKFFEMMCDKIFNKSLTFFVNIFLFIGEKAIKAII